MGNSKVPDRLARALTHPAVLFIISIAAVGTLAGYIVAR
jgi:hypothetical protein